VGFGLTFGLLDVALPAFARHHGAQASAGLLLAGLALGIGVGGYLYGLRPGRRPAAHEYPGLCALAALGLAPLALAPSVAVLVALTVAAGACFAPITAAQMAALDDVAPAGTRTEAAAWLASAYGAASAAGAALAGQLVDGPGDRAAMGAAVAATALAAAIALARRETLRAPLAEALSGGP
jgi:MFS family permease